MPFIVPFSLRILVSARVSIPAMPGMSCFTRKSWIVPSHRKLLGIRDNSLTIYPSGHAFFDSMSGVMP